jgi:hypothetical protein
VLEFIGARARMKMRGKLEIDGGGIIWPESEREKRATVGNFENGKNECG